jgi:hypothetical protein
MKRIALAMALVLIGLLALQCGNRRNVEADKAAVKELVQNDKNWFNSSTTTDSTHDTSFVMLGTDTLLFWWRGVQTHNDPIVNVQVSGDSAYVDWARNNFGDINLLIKVPDTSWQLWVKKVFETARVRGIFRRSGNSDDSARGWNLSAVSLAAGVSDSVHTVVIDSMRIQSFTSQQIYTVINPLETFYRIDSLPWFSPSEPVTITLYTNAFDGNAFLHTFVLAWPFYVRAQFNHLGNGVYQGSWLTQAIAYPRFAIFDVMDHRTLRTPDYAYDFSGWLFPYLIKATE